MLETSNVLINKVCLTVQKRDGVPGERELMGLVKSALYRQLCDYFRANIEWQRFNNGGQIGAPETTVSGVCVSVQSDGFAQWAMSLNVRDHSFSRRRWKYYVGLTQQANEELSFCYAKCCYDHMAGSISMPKPIISFQDLLIKPLFFLPSIQFMCGAGPYPTEALELNYNSLQSFTALVTDEKRAVPIMLISCPDILSPQKMMDIALGNLIVYWCADSKIILRLNGELPESMYTPWDSVHIFMPLYSPESFHPIHSYEEIYHMGTEHFVAGLRLAYCQSMRSEERKRFPTVEGVNRRRDQAYIQNLLEQREMQRERLMELTKQVASQNEMINQVTHSLSLYQMEHPEGQLAEYESLLKESLAEADTLKKGISALSSRIFSCMGIGFRPDDSQDIPLLQELEHAVYSALACAQQRKQ